VTPKKAGIPSRDQRRRIRESAYHEAGHAVAFEALGFAVHLISIVPDDSDNLLGKVLVNPLPRFRPLEAVSAAGREIIRQMTEDYAAALLAGRQAQLRVAPRSAGWPSQSD
jgi:ATP-dependent Zn protease